MKKISILLFLMVFMLIRLSAQTDDKAVATAALKALATRYLSAPMLSFDVSYYYSTENKQSVILDSLKGSMKMEGNRYWYSLDSTETLADSDNIVILYKEDKIMYISKPSAAIKGTSPLSMLDSLSVLNESLHYRLTSAGNQQVIIIQFPKGSVYREITYYIDKNSGLLEKTRAFVKASQLYTDEIRSQINDTEGYALIETKFSNYRVNSFDREDFSVAHYFKKEGSEYVVTEAYAGYKVFLGKPGL